MWLFTSLCLCGIFWCIGTLINHPFKEDVNFNGTIYLNFNAKCETCGKKVWRYSPGGYYLSKRVCMNCGLLQEASSNPLLLLGDTEEQAWDTEGFVDDPVKLVEKWGITEKKEQEERAIRLKETESKTKLFKAEDIGTKALLFTEHEVIRKVKPSEDTQ